MVLENGQLIDIQSKHLNDTLFVFELQLLLVKPPLFLIIKLVVEALNVARAHILSVQLLDLKTII